jgi:uncharacterized hydantoinase/oxoprolinase family protein
MAVQPDGMRSDTPGIPIETHYDSLDTSSFLWTGTLRKQVVYLFFGSVETQVTDLSSETMRTGADWETLPKDMHIMW